MSSPLRTAERPKLLECPLKIYYGKKKKSQTREKKINEKEGKEGKATESNNDKEDKSTGGRRKRGRRNLSRTLRK